MSDQNKNQQVADQYSELLPQLSRSATACVKLLSDSNNWPQGEEYEFNKAFRGFNSFVKNTQKQHEDLMQNISVCYRDYDQQLGSRSGNNNNNNDNEQKNNNNRSHHVNPIEAVDALFENVDHLLDSVRGVRVGADKQEEVRIGLTGLNEDSAAANKQATSSSNGNNNNNLLSRPQDNFTIPPDNFADEFLPFVATTSTTTSNTSASDNKNATAKTNNHPHRKYSSKSNEHPLGLSFMMSEGGVGFQIPQDHLVPPKKDQVFLALDQTPLTLIDTPQLLQDIIDTKFVNETALAVDLEHHSDHSYLGFTSLIQISTRSEDFIIDPLALRDEMWRLAPVFHNPSIVKVLHSAQEDVRWLQRDFGLFFVNLFDTAIALQALRMPHSLAFLVDHICQVKLNKQHQNDDWRLRPLPQSMLNYARQDTHYLLYCWDRLRTMLATADTRASVGNLLLYVLTESRRLAATLYKKPTFNPDRTWKEVFGRSISGLFPHQLKAIQNLFNWREVRARTIDTSPNSILMNGQLLAIACRLPSTAAEILRMANPATIEVRKNMRELLKLLDEARELMVSGSGSNQKNKDNNNSDNTTNQDAAERQNNKNNTDSSSNNGGAAPVFNATTIHQPMTGTLPSVQLSRQNENDVSSNNTSNNQNDEDIALSSFDLPSSSSSSSSWSKSLLAVPVSQEKEKNYWSPEALAKNIPVPMPKKLVVAGVSKLQSAVTVGHRRERDEAEEKKNEKEIGPDAPENENEDEVNVSTEHKEEPEETDTAGNNNEGRTNNNAKKNSDNVIQFPKSLAEEHGGLGRQTRKKQINSQRKK